nr:hypothetical protein [Tanacetum cinerariifolium]
MAVCTWPTLSPGMSARIAEEDALSPSSFRMRYRSSYEKPSSSPTLLIRKRYRGTLELVEDTEEETHSDSEIFSQTNRAQSSRVPIPLSNNPIRAVRQAHLVDTDIESKPLEDLGETKIPPPRPTTPLLVSPSDDPYLIVRQTHTPTIIDTESEPEEAPSET